MTYKVIKVYDMQERGYTDRQGMQQQWKSQGYLLHDGRNCFYAEAHQEVCASVSALGLKPNDVVLAHVQWQAREYKDGQGRIRVANEAAITNMTKVG